MQPTSKLNVAVLMGGKTAEHEISLQTGVEIANALSRDKYRVLPLVITKNGRWVWPGRALEGPREQLALSDVSSPGETAPALVESGSAPPRSQSGLQRLEPAPDRPVDVVFIALHGPNGEDGTVQGMLELLDVPYTGSGVMASAVAMNKPVAQQMLQLAGLTVPPGTVVHAKDWQRSRAGCVARLTEDPGLPCVMKPAGQGSSFGTSICHAADELDAAMELALRYEPVAMVEEYIKGTELTCGVLEDLDTRDPVPLPVIEIVPKATEFFDFRAKYDPALTDEIVPARIPDEVAARVQDAARRAHIALGCSAFSRTDLMLRDSQLYVLELNTIPGMTPNSLLPKAVRAAGMSFPELLDRLVQLAVNDHELRHWQNGR
jgi:D-alanine-D-alanine ligase